MTIKEDPTIVGYLNPLGWTRRLTLSPVARSSQALMTVDQHKRIVRALLTAEPDMVKVPRELLERIDADLFNKLASIVDRGEE